MIIIGFPGVGKSSVAKNRLDFIDFESCNFSKEPGWWESYCKAALDLSHQGYKVFVSSHQQVREFFSYHQGDTNVVEIYPSYPIKEIWIDRLKQRWLTDKEEKHKRAYEYMQNNFLSTIMDIECDGIANKIDLSEDDDLNDLYGTLVRRGIIQVEQDAMLTYEKASDGIKTWLGMMKKLCSDNEFAMEFINCAEYMTKAPIRNAIKRQQVNHLK